MTVRMQHRRGTAAQWTSANPVLGSGEIGVETDTLRAKIGDGSTAWTSLSYFTLENGSVTTPKLTDGAVTTAKLADAAVTAAKLSAGLGGLLTTKGDLVARDASTAVRLPVGADGTVLQADAGSAAGVRWSPTKALSGTGTPEGLITAAPGSTWLQTDSTTDVKGWIKWVKATGTGNTGWQAGAEADTGWRETTTWDTAGTVTGIALEANAVPKAGTAGWIRMRRVGGQVFIALSGLDVGTGTVAIYGTGAMPGGFNLQSPANNPVFPISNGTVTAAIGAPVSATGLGISQPSGQMFGGTSAPVVASAVTSDTWPTSLPGVAV